MGKIHLGLLAAGFWLCASVTLGQSSVECQTGAAIEVQTGADVSADSIITNSNYSGGGTFNGGPLPVTMTAMSVQAAKNTATIIWRTESETENHGFEIERRSVGVYEGESVRGEAWQVVGFVQGAGTSSSPLDYSFVDQQVTPGRHAYRIKQIDLDGSFTYTSSLEVEIGLAPLEFALWQNYPNPFNPSTSIEFAIPADGHVTLKVFDLTGREVASLVNGQLKAGVRHQVLFDASGLASRSYIARIDHQNRYLTTKMSVVK